MALTGGGVNTDLCLHRPRFAFGKKKQTKSLGPRSSFGCGEWCPLSFGFGLVTEDHHSTRGLSFDCDLWSWITHRRFWNQNFGTTLPQEKHAAFVSFPFSWCMQTFENLLCLHLQGLCVHTFTAKMALPFWLKPDSLLRNSRKTHPPTPE